jgi:hypothetical protein
VLLALLLGVAAAFVFSPTPSTTSTTTQDLDVDRTHPDATPEPRTPRRARAADETPAVETPASDVDPEKWPIRVTTNVPGATVTMQVRLYGGDPDPPPETKTTDAKGFVGFAAPAKDVPVHRFEFVARAEEWTTGRGDLTQPGDVRIELEKGIAVRGRVVDDAGRPVERAMLVPTFDPMASGGGEFLVELLAESTSDGSFEAFVEKPGAVTLNVQHAAFLGREVNATAPASGLVVVLERGLQVSGRVAFPDGRPVPGVAVMEDSGRRRDTTDAEGRYVASGLQRGPVTLKCALSSEKRTVEAGATNVDFVVKRSVARVRFLDAQGRPFRSPDVEMRVVKDGAVVEMSAGEGPTDGEQMMSGPAGAQVLVSASCPDGRTGSGKATFDETPRLHDVDVVLGAPRPTGTIRLLVRWESAETPKAVYVTVDDDVGATVAGDGRKRFDLDAAGAGEIPKVPAGHVKLTVAAAGHWTGEALDSMLVTSTSSVDVDVGRTTEVVATLATGGRVRATVRDENGVAIAPDLVRLRSSSDSGRSEMFVHRSPDGGWTSELDTSPSVMIDAVPPGRYVVSASKYDGRVGEKEVDVEKGKTVDVEVTVKPTK